VAFLSLANLLVAKTFQFLKQLFVGEHVEILSLTVVSVIPTGDLLVHNGLSALSLGR